MSAPPAMELEATQAKILGHLFENPRVSVPRNVYWAVDLEFLPLVVDSEEWPASLSCEWIEWPARDWTELDQCSVSLSQGSDRAEASLYLYNQHQPLDELVLTLELARDCRFLVRYRGVLNVRDLEGRLIEGVSLEGECEAVFEGLVVVANNFFPKPESEIDVEALLEPFADLSSYEVPEEDGFRWIARPKVDRNTT